MEAQRNQAEKSPAEDKKITVNITYNGVTQPFEEPRKAAVQSLLARAIAKFGTHQLVLYWPDGNEVTLNGSIEDAGIEDGTTLILRPHAVRGGRQ